MTQFRTLLAQFSSKNVKCDYFNKQRNYYYSLITCNLFDLASLFQLSPSKVSLFCCCLLACSHSHYPTFSIVFFLTLLCLFILVQCFIGFFARRLTFTIDLQYDYAISLLYTNCVFDTDHALISLCCYFFAIVVAFIVQVLHTYRSLIRFI